MKTILEKTLEAILVLLCIFILGMFPSTFVSIVASIFTDVTFSDCVEFPPFWIVSLLGWVIAGGYIDHVIKTS